jgi:hypothetical protein
MQGRLQFVPEQAFRHGERTTHKPDGRDGMLNHTVHDRAGKRTRVSARLAGEF